VNRLTVIGLALTGSGHPWQSIQFDSRAARSERRR